MSFFSSYGCCDSRCTLYVEIDFFFFVFSIISSTIIYLSNKKNNKIYYDHFKYLHLKIQKCFIKNVNERKIRKLFKYQQKPNNFILSSSTGHLNIPTGSPRSPTFSNTFGTRTFSLDITD